MLAGSHRLGPLSTSSTEKSWKYSRWTTAHGFVWAVTWAVLSQRRYLSYHDARVSSMPPSSLRRPDSTKTSAGPFEDLRKPFPPSLDSSPSTHLTMQRTALNAALKAATRAPVRSFSMLASARVAAVAANRSSAAFVVRPAPPALRPRLLTAPVAVLARKEGHDLRWCPRDRLRVSRPSRPFFKSPAVGSQSTVAPQALRLASSQAPGILCQRHPRLDRIRIPGTRTGSQRS